MLKARLQDPHIDKSRGREYMVGGRPVWWYMPPPLQPHPLPLSPKMHAWLWCRSACCTARCWATTPALRPSTHCSLPATPTC